MAIQEAVTSSRKTSSGVVLARPGLVYGVSITPAAAASNVQIFDNASSAAGTIVAEIGAVANGVSVIISFNNPIFIANGIYASLSGASATCIVYYSQST